MAEGLSQAGYVVLLPDLFYRYGAYGPFDPGSPHAYASKLQAELYIAAAENDGSYPPDMAERLGQALDAAHVSYRTETYPAAHGWMKPDFPVYDETSAERGWREMLAFLERTLHAERPDESSRR